MVENLKIDLVGIWERIQIAFKTKNGAKIARQVNLHPTAVYKWRDGKNPPSHETLLKISEVTGCSLDWLLTGQGGQFRVVGEMGTNEPLIVILTVDSKIIEQALEKKGWTMQTLAEKTGLAYNTVHSFVRGKTVRFDGKAIGLMLYALELQPGEIFRLAYEDSDLKRRNFIFDMHPAV